MLGSKPLLSNKVTTWICDWHLKWGQYDGTELLACGLWHCVQVNSVKAELNCRTPSCWWRTAWCVENSHIWYQYWSEEWQQCESKDKKQECFSSLFIYLFIYSFFLSFLVYLLFKYSCLHFHPTTAPCPTHPNLPPSNIPPLALSMCPLPIFLDRPSPIFPHYPSPPSPPGTISLFSIPVFLVILCLFVLLIRFHL